MARLTLLLIGCFLFSCGSEKNIPDVSGVNVKFGLFQTEKLFDTDDRDSLVTRLNGMQGNHPSFYSVYFEHVFPVGPAQNTDSLALAILDFKKQPLADTLLRLVNTKYSDLGDLQKELEQAFRFVKYYFPEKEAPDVYTFISEYGLQGFIFEGNGGKDALGIGLDMYLSDVFEYKRLEPDNPGFSSYITRSWNRDHIVKKSMDVWLSDFVEPARGNTLLDQMISNGKKLYILAQCMPETHDTIVFEYPKTALDWCQNNELQMWSFFVEKNLLQDVNPIQIGKYINPSPDSPGMPREAPGRTGNYVGYKIVEAYMNKNKDITLPQLAAETDAQKIYKLSKYKPKRN